MLGITMQETRVYQEAQEAERRILAMKMLQEKLPIETVAQITEYTIVQLQEFQTNVMS